MDRAEFAKVMAYISVAVGKPMAAEAVEVYFDLLNDIPANVLQVAAKRVILEHRWKTFPTVAELREAVAETVCGQTSAMTSGEAWKLAWRAVGRIDPERDETARRELERLPPRVAEAILAYGVRPMCFGGEPVAVVRAQFIKIFEGLVNRDRREAILPEGLRKAIKEIGAKEITDGTGGGRRGPRVAAAVRGIGHDEK